MYRIRDLRDDSYLSATGAHRGCQAGFSRIWGGKAQSLGWNTREEAERVLEGEFSAHERTHLVIDPISLADALDARDAHARQGAWVPASGGTETPFYTRGGRRLLYCYQATTGDHAYLDCDTDLILGAEESNAALGYKVG